jgi:hypothetical protein
VSDEHTSFKLGHPARFIWIRSVRSRTIKWHFPLIAKPLGWFKRFSRGWVTFLLLTLVGAFRKPQFVHREETSEAHG